MYELNPAIDIQPEIFKASGNIYLDHNATTPICQLVKNQIPNYLDLFGNASSIHQSGRGPKNILRESRQNIAQLLGVKALEVVFTSGGTEANNLVLRGVFDSIKIKNKDKNNTGIHFLISSVEHPSVAMCKYLENFGLSWDYIEIKRDGSICLDTYRKLFKENTALVSCMLANNETGSIFPIKEMCAIAHEKNALFHTDAVQALGKMEFSLKDLAVDFASFSAHKFYSLKACGVLYAKSGTAFEALVRGGGQERYRRGGTENILSIAALGFMAKTFQSKIPAYCSYVTQLRDDMEKQIFANITGVALTGAGVARTCGSSSMTIEGIDGEILLMNLDMNKISVSTGAACSSGSPEPSPVLLSMGLTRVEAQSSLRISLGWGSTKDEVDYFVQVLKKVVERIRNIDK